MPEFISAMRTTTRPVPDAPLVNALPLMNEANELSGTSMLLRESSFCQRALRISSIFEIDVWFAAILSSRALSGADMDCCCRTEKSGSSSCSSIPFVRAARDAPDDASINKCCFTSGEYNQYISQ